MKFLVYEDFGTRGLCGDTTRHRDPEPNSTELEDFYWFWWNIGRSGKSGADRGRWGLGKTVFHSTSKINTIFGLTIRQTDNRRLLMGQSVLKTHCIKNDEYPPEGFYHDPLKTEPVYQPVEDATTIDAFSKMFGLNRTNEPGLSIIVPHRFDTLSAREILRSVIIHYFLPILRGQLVVEVSGPDLKLTVLTKSTIRSASMELQWKGKRSDKKHAPPPFDLAEWAIAEQAKGIEDELKPAGIAGAPAWSEDLIPKDMMTALRAKFSGHQRIAVRVPMTVEKKGGQKLQTYFDVFIEQDDGLDKGEDDFIREGMTISKITTVTSKKGVRGLVLVEHKVLSSLLGDAEGPAHNDWGRGEDRPNRSYSTWPSRVSFVKNSLVKLIDMLTPPPQDLNEDLLSHIFSVADASKLGTKKGKRKKPVGPTPPPPPPPVIKGTPRWFKVVQTSGGFKIRRSNAAPLPNHGAKLRVRVAYDLPDGDPFGNWSKYDFVFDGKATNPVKLKTAGAKLSYSATNANHLEIDVQQDDFEVEASGFDLVRDLVIRTNDERQSESDVLVNAETGGEQ
jgi:hypothetical protein